MKPILEIRNLSKKFRIRHQEPYLSLRDKVSGLWRSKQGSEDFWALHDVNYDVYPGDSVGIIGRNGAGKSTLLKILSRITPPSSGKIVGRGRVASLLEVGTGFHPELTGRENIFLNGSILGMKRLEMVRQFDAIVDFAGTGNFLDTPLKHYSSGMQLRLAFSVAAFLEPEILIIDEVLAVGDAEFQKKCLGKMEEVSKSGRTILFVSHNMAAVASLCGKALLLNQGVVIASGGVQEVTDEYQRVLSQAAGSNTGTILPASANGIIRKIELYCDGHLSSVAHMGCELEIRVFFESASNLDFPVLGLIFKDAQNTPLIGVNNKHYRGNLALKPLRAGCISMNIKSLPLFEGSYIVDVHFGNGFHDLEVLRECFQLTVEAMKFSDAGEWPDKHYNKVFLKDVEWTLHGTVS